MVRQRVFDPSPIVVEDEQTHCRRQVAAPPVGIDRRGEVSERYVPLVRDFFEALPKRVFQTDTRLVAANQDRSFSNGRLHRIPSIGPSFFATLR
jgi:hypothetical protein